jgi:hypothetical protein
MLQIIYLNINFRFGNDFYNITPTSDWLSLFFTLIGAAFGAWLGFKLYIRKERVIKKKDLLFVKEYFIENIEKAQENVYQQKEKWIESSKVQKKNFYEYSKVSRLTFKNLINISQLNTKDLFEAYRDNLHIIKTAYYDLFITTDYIQDILNAVNTSNIENQKSYFKNINEIEKNLIYISVCLKQRKNYLQNRNLSSGKEFIFIEKLLAENKSIHKKSTENNSHNFEQIKTVYIYKIKDCLLFEFSKNKMWIELQQKAYLIDYCIVKNYTNNIAFNKILDKNILKLKEELDDLLTLKDLLTVNSIQPNRPLISRLKRIFTSRQISFL